MADSATPAEVASTARPGKSDRLIGAACDLVYRQGVERTTLADIAEAADVPAGNVYYYFKTKNDIVAAVVQTHVEQIESALAALEQRHRNPKTRLKALVGVVTQQRDSIAHYGCPYGSLCSELAKGAAGSEPFAAQLMHVLLGWTERQFRSMGRRDAHDLAVELVAAYQGSAVLANALGQPEVLARQARRLERRIETLSA